MKEKVLVSGASGFCGLHLCRYLAEKHYKVIGTYLNHPPDQGKEPAGAAFFPLDITSFDEVQRFVGEHKPSAIFHLAAQSVPRLSWKFEDDTYRINVGGTLHFLEALRRHAPGARLLLASSIQVYGRTFRSGKKVAEQDLCWPESPYATSKALAELACLNYTNQFGIHTVIARAFNHLGPGQSLQFVFSDWCRQIALAELGKRRRVLEVGNLDAYRDFLHVRDVARAYELLIRKAGPGSIFNICQGRIRVLRDFIDFLLSKSLIPIKIEIQSKRLRRNDPPVMRGSASRLQSLGWRPRYSPLQALEELLEEWRLRVRRENQRVVRRTMKS